MKGGGGRTHFRLLFSRTEAVGETEMKILHEYISCLTLFRDGKTFHSPCSCCVRGTKIDVNFFIISFIGLLMMP